MNAAYGDLAMLREKYSPMDGNIAAFLDAFKRYATSKRQSLVDLTLAAASISPQIFIDKSNIDPLIEKAIKETNPNFDPSLFSDFSEEKMMGILNSAKGKYFEYLVTDKLNAGEAVGDLQLPEGYQAVMATNANQPGWDIQILDPQGNTAEYLQLKATNSLGYINEILERYPDITILATDEVADQANGLVLDSNITEDDLREQILGTFSDLEPPSLIDNWIDAFNPLMPLVFIIAS